MARETRNKAYINRMQIDCYKWEFLRRNEQYIKDCEKWAGRKRELWGDIIKVPGTKRPYSYWIS